MNPVSKKAKKAQWSELPEDLCVLIAKKLPSVVDVIARFGAVCHSWEAAFSNNRHSLLLPRSPCLMLVDDNKASLVLFPRNKLIPFQLPRITGRDCFGTQYGWLITVSVIRQVHLVNTISGIRYRLPDVPLPERSSSSAIYKAVTSLTSPSSTIPENCVVMVIYKINNQLGFAKPGDTAWNTLEIMGRGYDDMIYFKGQFFSVTFSGELKFCDILDPLPGVKEFATPPVQAKRYFTYKFYLVEMQGQLHVIVRTYNTGGVNKVAFDIYRLDFQVKTWTRMVSIDEHALFVGGTSCFFVLASDYPDCKGNSIYFTYDHHLSSNVCVGYDVGVFDVNLGKMNPVNGFLRKIPKGGCGCNGSRIFDVDFRRINPVNENVTPGISISDYHVCCPPLWIIPNIF